MIDMGSLCEEMITAAAKIVATRDKELMEDIFTMEEEINQKERDIERICMKLLMQQQPVASDLRVISAAMKMVSDMERIGDQACDITGIVRKDAEVLEIRENTHLDKMAKATINMVSKSVQSFIKQNLMIAHEVIEQDDTVDELFNKVKKETISLIHEDPEKGEDDYYYYKKPVSEGESTTELFTGIRVAKEMEQKELEVSVYEESVQIQKGNMVFHGYREAWDAYERGGQT